MPNTISSARSKRRHGSGSTDNYERVTYRATSLRRAVIVEAMTATPTDRLRQPHYFDKYNGKLGAAICVPGPRPEGVIVIDIETGS
jgi:transcriptional/translational regulatory protein YebC/TACO1